MFSIVLRVEMVASELVAYIRDTSDTITKSEFDEAIATKEFPRCIKNNVQIQLFVWATLTLCQILRSEVDPYEICEHLPKKTVLYTDLVNFTKYSNGTDIYDVYKYVNTMYKGKFSFIL